MKSTKPRNFEDELPAGYRQALYINAKSAKFGIVFNLLALAVEVVIMMCAVLLLRLKGATLLSVFEESSSQIWIGYIVLLASMFAYIVLHELVHGIAYKALTGERLTFGISWSCAFCGVPKIFTYRRTAIIATASPLAVFTLIFIPILILTYIFSPLYFLITALVSAVHFGGCCGDIYVLYLLGIRFKDKRTLVRDTGPEQFFYVPNENF